MIDGLKRLEYRGYDSCGIAVLDNGTPRVVRAAGRITNLESKAHSLTSRDAGVRCCARQVRELGKVELYPPGTAGWAWKLARSSSRSVKQVVRNVLPSPLAGRIVALRKPKKGKDIDAPRPDKDGQFPCLTLDGR